MRRSSIALLALSIAGISLANDEVSPVRMKRTFDFGSLQIRVYHWGEDGSYSLGHYLVVVADASDTLGAETGPTDGPLMDVWVTDLDHDGNPEIILWAKCVGSGGYGEVYFLEWQDGKFLMPELPPLTPAQQDGYMGHDVFRIRNNRLIREFPIYRETDPNSTPTGGTRTIEYAYRERQLFRYAPQQGEAETP